MCRGLFSKRQASYCNPAAVSCTPSSSLHASSQADVCALYQGALLAQLIVGAIPFGNVVIAPVAAAIPTAQSVVDTLKQTPAFFDKVTDNEYELFIQPPNLQRKHSRVSPSPRSTRVRSTAQRISLSRITASWIYGAGAPDLTISLSFCKFLICSSVLHIFSRYQVCRLEEVQHLILTKSLPITLREQALTVIIVGMARRQTLSTWSSIF